MWRERARQTATTDIRRIGSWRAAPSSPTIGAPTSAREESARKVSLGVFVLSLLGQVVFGRLAYNSEREQWGESAVTLLAYLTSGHFAEALFENWESEFLQMGLFVWLSARLVQKGSAESRSIDEENKSDEDPRRHQSEPDAPWPVKRGGWLLWLYERSLGPSAGPRRPCPYRCAPALLASRSAAISRAAMTVMIFDLASIRQFAIAHLGAINAPV